MLNSFYLTFKKLAPPLKGRKIYEKGCKGHKKSYIFSLDSEMSITIVLDSKNLYPKKCII
jgi:hypothetical protein